MVTSSSDLTYITLIEGAIGWGSSDYQGVIVLETHWRPGLLSYMLTLAPAVSRPMISTENAITATSPGTRSTRSSWSQLGIKTADLVSLITRRDDGTWDGDESSSCRLIGSLDEIMCVIQTTKKSEGGEVLKKDPLISSLSFLLVWPIALQMFWRRALTCRR